MVGISPELRSKRVRISSVSTVLGSRLRGADSFHHSSSLVSCQDPEVLPVTSQLMKHPDLVFAAASKIRCLIRHSSWCPSSPKSVPHVNEHLTCPPRLMRHRSPLHPCLFHACPRLSVLRILSSALFEGSRMLFSMTDLRWQHRHGTWWKDSSCLLSRGSIDTKVECDFSWLAFQFLCSGLLGPWFSAFV